MAERRELRSTFGAVAGRYHAARPRYPAALFDALEQATGLAAPSELLEIGCATGIATELMARRGHRITCVELGAALASQARVNLAGAGQPRGYPDVAVVHASFDAWDPPTWGPCSPSTGTYDADGYIALLDTFSGHITMQDPQRKRLDDEIRRRLGGRPEGTLRRHWGAVLHACRRRDDPRGAWRADEFRGRGASAR